MNDKEEIEDNLDKDQWVVKIYIAKNGRPYWKWQGLNRHQLRSLFLQCFDSQTYYNIEQAIKEKDKPKIVKPNLNDVIISNRK